MQLRLPTRRHRRARHRADRAQPRRLGVDGRSRRQHGRGAERPKGRANGECTTCTRREHPVSLREPPRKLIHVCCRRVAIRRTGGGTRRCSVKDPVCGMTVEPAKAAATSEYQGQTYYFCSAG
ncbi:YHS domain-containing protein, partial [Luteitalea sp.]|uniref:YHS domain-containing protein n=1 Tax=Luteitalea sp. TaxID=2004800 RepID=UPI003458BEA9